MNTARTFLGTELALNMQAVREDARRIQLENEADEQAAKELALFEEQLKTTREW